MGPCLSIADKSVKLAKLVSLSIFLAKKELWLLALQFVEMVLLLTRNVMIKIKLLETDVKIVMLALSIDVKVFLQYASQLVEIKDFSLTTWSNAMMEIMFQVMDAAKTVPWKLIGTVKTLLVKILSAVNVETASFKLFKDKHVIQDKLVTLDASNAKSKTCTVAAESLQTVPSHVELMDSRQNSESSVMITT